MKKYHSTQVKKIENISSRVEYSIDIPIIIPIVILDQYKEDAAAIVLKLSCNNKRGSDLCIV